MKRSFHIIVSLALSAMIVLLSVGVSFVDCCNTQLSMVDVATAMGSGDNGGGSDSCCCCANAQEHQGQQYRANAQEDCCGCAPQAKCTTVTVAKLAPFDNGTQESPCFVCPMALLPCKPLQWLLSPLTATTTIATPTPNGGDGGSPPRSRLLRLRVLRL